MIRIFVGAPSNNEDLESQSVLEWSIRKYASEPVDIVWMKASNDPHSFWHGWLMRAWATPFSGFRWGVPAFCKFEGKAIYLDVDMILRADIAELWHTEIKEPAFCVARDQRTFCCVLFDCKRAKAHIPDVQLIKKEPGLYGRLKNKFQPGHVQPFAKGQNWNCWDGERYATIADPEIKLVHCTNIPTQPQLKYALPRLAAMGAKHWSRTPAQPHWRRDIVQLFDALLEEAKQNGYPPERYQGEPFGNYAR